MLNMDELLVRLEQEFCDGDGGISIVGADWFANSLRLDISVRMNDDKATELWEISCEQTFEESITSEFAESLTLTSDSPLLIPYKDNEVQLAFAENKVSPNELFGVITSACYEILGPSFNISKYLNMIPSSKGICSSEYGVLGRFPERIAKRILVDLAGLDIRVRMLDGFAPKFWTGSEHIPYPDGLKALCVGSSYVIGTDFSAVRA